jgi:hypothetical protein
VIYPQVTVEEWCKRYPALAVVKRPCRACRKQRLACVPFIEREWVGLRSAACPCGKGQSLSVSTLRPSSQLNSLMSDWFEGVVKC